LTWITTQPAEDATLKLQGKEIAQVLGARGSAARWLVLVAVAILPGCIVVPLPQGEGVVTEGREVPREPTSAIQIGRMSRAELIASLGEPAAIWEERRILVYAWDRVHTKVLWILAGGLRAAGGLIDVPTHYLLLVQLDDDDHVSRAERCVRPLSVGFGAFLREWADGKACA
jgi:hypothetical protein